MAFSTRACLRLSSARSLLSASQCLLARHGHGGIQQAAKSIERLTLLEQALEKPTGERASEGGQNASDVAAAADTAAFLRGIPERLAEIRPSQRASEDETGGKSLRGDGAQATLQSSGKGFGRPTTTVVTEATDELGEHEVVSLAHFLAACKQHRLDIGAARQADERRRRRRRYRDFWHHSIGSAVRCCQPSGGRDFSFLALHGLADSELQLDFEAMVVSLRMLDQERLISSCMDMTRSLQYLARELQRQERIQRANPTATGAPSHDALRRYRSALTDLAVERISFFFLEHAPAKLVLPCLRAAHRGDVPFREGTLLGTGDDALCALEVLAALDVRDVSPSVAQTIIVRVTAADKAHYEQHRQFILDSIEPLSVRGVGALPDAVSAPAAVTELTQFLLVSRTFCYATHEHRQLSFTAIVQGFALLRIFLPVLWPPYAPRRAKAPAATGDAPSPPPPRARTEYNLGDEKDALQRICWGLAVAVKKRDARFTNPYHFVKIVTTLAKLPSFVLSPSPPPRRAESRASVSVASPEQERVVAWTAEAFWSFMVSKACIFVPNLPIDQRRLVCRGLNLAIREKRGRLLGAHVPPRHDTSLAEAGRTPALVDLQGTAEDILLPLVEDMSTLEENFDVSVRRAMPRDGGHRRSTAAHKDASRKPRPAT